MHLPQNYAVAIVLRQRGCLSDLKCATSNSQGDACDLVHNRLVRGTKKCELDSRQVAISSALRNEKTKAKAKTMDRAMACKKLAIIWQTSISITKDALELTNYTVTSEVNVSGEPVLATKDLPEHKPQDFLHDCRTKG